MPAGSQSPHSTVTSCRLLQRHDAERQATRRSPPASWQATRHPDRQVAATRALATASAAACGARRPASAGAITSVGDAVIVAEAALIGVAVALDQARATPAISRARSMLSGAAARTMVQPALDLAPAPRRSAKLCGRHQRRLRQQAQARKPQIVVGAHMHGEIDLAQPAACAPPRPGDARASAGGRMAADLLDARLEMLGDLRAARAAWRAPRQRTRAMRLGARSWPAPRGSRPRTTCAPRGGAPSRATGRRAPAHSAVEAIEDRARRSGDPGRRRDGGCPSSTMSRLAAGYARARALDQVLDADRAAAWRLRCSRTACSSSPRAWPRPKAKAARLVSTDLPACADRGLEGRIGNRQPARTRQGAQQRRR